MKFTKYFIQTYGCDANSHDSEKLSGYLKNAGYTPVEKLAFADIVVLNSCAIRHTAEAKVWGQLGFIKNEKKKREIIVVFAGCMPAVHKTEIGKKYGWIDIVISPEMYIQLPSMLEKYKDSNFKKDIDTFVRDFSNEKYYDQYKHSLFHRGSPISAFVEIMTGCDNFCSYCIVPFARGREKSRKFDAILDEVKFLIDSGYKEIVLLGQNVNSYCDPQSKKCFIELLEQVALLNPFRIRFFTSHPKDFDNRIPELIKSYNNIARNIHLPIQSGDNHILDSMNRKYTVEHFAEIRNSINSIKGISCSTDIIVGFPGETDEMFQNSLNNIKKLDFDSAYTFKYSVRQNTVAASLKNQIDEETKRNRLEQLMEMQNAISFHKNQEMVGTVQEILVDGTSKTDTEKLTGKTSCNRTVNFTATSNWIGEIVKVKIKKAGTWSLDGEMLGEMK